MKNMNIMSMCVFQRMDEYKKETIEIVQKFKERKKKNKGKTERSAKRRSKTIMFTKKSAMKKSAGWMDGWVDDLIAVLSFKGCLQQSEIHQNIFCDAFCN